MRACPNQHDSPGLAQRVVPCPCGPTLACLGSLMPWGASAGSSQTFGPELVIAEVGG